jgi:hypothetical protein
VGICAFGSQTGLLLSCNAKARQLKEREGEGGASQGERLALGVVRQSAPKVKGTLVGCGARVGKKVGEEKMGEEDEAIIVRAAFSYTQRSQRRPTVMKGSSRRNIQNKMADLREWMDGGICSG